MGEKKIETAKREWMSPKTLNEVYDVSTATVYDWHYRPESYTYPPEMILKSGRNLRINVAIFENWWMKRASSK